MLRASITLPDDIFIEAKAVAGNNLSALVAEALRKYLQDLKTKKALNSFGSWQDREKNSVDIVNESRSDEGRSDADSNN
jgi:post-segregation antitoxin (ccd killing protein)